MRAKKLFFIIIVLISFCLIGSVSAADNQTITDSQIADNINVSFHQKVYEQDLGTIDVEVPENTSGNLKAEMDGVEFYNENITGSVKVPISIPKGIFPYLVINRDSDYTSHFIYLFYNGIELKMNHSLQVMRVSPEWQTQGFKTEILQYDDSDYCMIYFPYSACGKLEIYIDGELSQKLNASHYTFLNNTQFNRLALGNHTVRIVYYGDDYYKPFNKTFSFDVVDMTIHIPQNILLEHDDCITAKTLDNTDGKVYVFVDGVLVYKDKLDGRGEFLHSMFKNITCGQHLIEVQYNASKFSKSKKVLVNVSYEMDIFSSGSMIYGSDNEIIIIVPTDANKNLVNITINGFRYTDFEIDNSGWIELDISKFDVGNYNMIVNYIGDSKYYSQTKTHEFNITYQIITPYSYFFDDEYVISLTLPASADGNLEVYLEGKLFKTTPLKKGKASISLVNLIPGNYNLTARYTGDDFDVNESSILYTVRPYIRTPGEIVYGENQPLTVVTSTDAKGYVVFYGLDKNYTAVLKNGKASLSLKNLAIGYYEDVYVDYFGENGFNCTLYSYIEVLAPEIKISNVNVYYNNNAKVKVYLNGKLAKNTLVNFKVGSKTLKVKTDKNGVATLKVSTLTSGKYNLVASYMGAKSSKKLTVKRALSLNSISVKKSTKKVTLTAKVKNGKYKQVTFKFNGKTLKVKTNSKGIAKASFKVNNLKIGKKILYSAKYVKENVKKATFVLN